MSDDQVAAAPEHNYEYGREHGGYSHMGIPPACPACAAEPAPDPTPSATLAGIRERYRRCGNSPDIHVNLETWIDSANDIPPLVAALEAVLALADKWAPKPNAVPLTPRQVAAVAFRQVITTALTGTPQLGEDEGRA